MKLFTLIMIIALTTFTFAQASSPVRIAQRLSKQASPNDEGSERELEPPPTDVYPGERVTGRFAEGEGEHTFPFRALPMHAYSLRSEGGAQLVMEILDQSGEVLFSSDENTDDQTSVSGRVHWDCMDGGSYVLRISPAAGTEPVAGEYIFILEEDPGWLVATSLTRFPSMNGLLDYQGDVDYYVFERTEEARTYKIKVEGYPTTVLFWVDTGERLPEALIQGEELEIVENYPGGGLAENDSYYGVSGPAGNFSVEGSEDKKGGMSTWLIIGIVGGVVVVLLAIVAISSIGDSCGSCSDPFGSFGNLDKLGCSGN